MSFEARPPMPGPRPLPSLTPDRVVRVAVALGSAICGDFLMQPFAGRAPLERALGASLTGLFGYAGARWALAREPTDWGALRTSAATGAVVLIWFVLCQELLSLHASGHAGSFASLLLPVSVAAFAALGAVIGTLFHLTTLAHLGEGGRRRRQAAPRDPGPLDAPERVLVPACSWLCVLGVLFLRLHGLRPTPALALVAAGATGLLVVIGRDARRLAWLSALYAGKRRAFRLSRIGGPRPCDAPAFGPYREAHLDGAVVCCAAEAGPYRTAPPGPAIARLPLRPAIAKGAIALRMAVSGVTAVAALIAAIAAFDLTAIR